MLGSMTTAPKKGRRIAAPREEEPVRNRSQTWQDRDGVWHNWRTPEPASESTSARTRNAQQTWHQTGQDWRRDRPSSSQDWRYDWQWEGDRDRTCKAASNAARGSQQPGPEDEPRVPPVVEISSGRLPQQESVKWWRSVACLRPSGRSYTKLTRRAPPTSSETSLEEEISKSSTPASTPTWHAVRCRVVAIGH